MLAVYLLEPAFNHQHFLLAEVVLFISQLAIRDGLGIGVLEFEALYLSLGFSVDDLEFAVPQFAHEESLKWVIFRPAEAPLLLLLFLGVLVGVPSPLSLGTHNSL